jgi:hypothetical protein
LPGNAFVSDSRGRLTITQMMSGLALGETTSGPLVMTASRSIEIEKKLSAGNAGFP